MTLPLARCCREQGADLHALVITSHQVVPGLVCIVRERDAIEAGGDLFAEVRNEPLRPDNA
jgi:hypothetical protein